MATTLDTFNRANGSLGTADSGQTWSTLTGTTAIASNKATVTAGAPSATAALPYGNHDNGAFSLKIAVSSTSANPAGLVMRILDNNNRIGCFLAPSTQKAQIFKTDGGTTTMLAEANATIAANTTYTVKAILTGAKIDMYVDGVFYVTFTLTGGDETQYTNANGYTKVGFRGDTAASFDDLVDEGGTQTVTTTGIATAEAFGTAVVTQNVVVTGIATAEAFGTVSVAQTVAPGGIASPEAFGAPVLTQAPINQTITPTGIASAEAIGALSLGGPFIFPTSIPSAETFGATRLVQYPTRVQDRWIFLPKNTFDINVPFDQQAAVVNHAIVFVGAFHHDIGTLTLDGPNWRYPVNLRSFSLSLVIAWKPAAGGETGVTGHFTQGNDTGSNMLVIEYASQAPGQWSELGVGSNNTDETNVLVKASGTTPATIGDGIGVAGFGLGNVGPDSTDSFSNSYNAIFTQGGGQFESGVFAADKLIPFGSTTSTTLTRSGAGVAHKMSGGLVVLGRSAVQAIAPAGIASAEAIGTPDFPASPQPPSIPSEEAFGTAVVAVQALAITPAGIPSAEVFGAHVVHIGPVLFVTGIPSAEAFGTPTAGNGVRHIALGPVVLTSIYVGTARPKIYQGTTLVFQ